MIMTNKNNSSKLSEFREITEYRPSGVFQKEFRSLNNYKCYYTVGRLPSSSYFYKYLDLDSALKKVVSILLIIAIWALMRLRTAHCSLPIA